MALLKGIKHRISEIFCYDLVCTTCRIIATQRPQIQFKFLSGIYFGHALAWDSCHAAWRVAESSASHPLSTTPHQHWSISMSSFASVIPFFFCRKAFCWMLQFQPVDGFYVFFLALLSRALKTYFDFFQNCSSNTPLYKFKISMNLFLLSRNLYCITVLIIRLS